jgi:hypothetical protein
MTLDNNSSNVFANRKKAEKKTLKWFSNFRKMAAPHERFARSRLSQGNQRFRAVLRGRFLLPRPSGNCRGSTGEAAGSML